MMFSFSLVARGEIAFITIKPFGWLRRFPLNDWDKGNLMGKSEIIYFGLRDKNWKFWYLKINILFYLISLFYNAFLNKKPFWGTINANCIVYKYQITFWVDMYLCFERNLPRKLKNCSIKVQHLNFRSLRGPGLKLLKSLFF